MKKSLLLVFFLAVILLPTACGTTALPVSSKSDAVAAAMRFDAQSDGDNYADPSSGFITINGIERKKNEVSLSYKTLVEGYIVAALYGADGRMVCAEVKDHLQTNENATLSLPLSEQMEIGMKIRAFLLDATFAPLASIAELDIQKPEPVFPVLVAYFSATNNTKGIAEKIAEAAGGQLYEITPAVPYTSEDLNYNDRSTRATSEQNDPNARPEINGTVDQMENYDVVFLGYPIWWGQAPKILYTFVESYDFSDKTIIPFCTSGSSPLGTSAENLKNSSNKGNWLEGKRFQAGASDIEIAEWVNALNLPGREAESDQPAVYFTADISPEGLAMRL